MTKDVWISLRGLQFSGNEAAENIETAGAGTYYEKNGNHYVIYEEVIEGLQKPVMNKLKFGEYFLELSRNGSLNVRMMFEENKKHTADYHTPYGKMTLGIDTKKFRMVNQADKMKLDIEYTLEQNNEYLADCKILIEVRSKS